jgi:hypothetical protein
VRAETQTARILNRTKHHLAGELDRRLKRIAVVSGEEIADEPPQTKIVHDFRAEGIFHPQTVNVGEIAAHRDLAMPVPASDQHRHQAISPRCRILMQRPARVITNSQASTPGRADPAAGHSGPGCFSLGQDGRRADQATRLGRPDPQRTGDLLRGLPPLPQHTHTLNTLIGLHRNRS